MKKWLASGFSACLVLCCLFAVSNSFARAETVSQWDFTEASDISSLIAFDGSGAGEIGVRNGHLRLANAAQNDALYGFSQYFLNVNAGETYTVDLRLRVERGMLAITHRGQPGAVWDNRGYAALVEREGMILQRRGETLYAYGSAETSFDGFVAVRFVVDGFRVRVYFGEEKSSVLNNGGDASGWTSGVISLTVLNTEAGKTAEVFLDSLSFRPGCDDAWNARPLPTVAAYDFSDADQLEDFIGYDGNSGGSVVTEDGNMKLSGGQNLPLYGSSQFYLRGSACERFTLECTFRVEAGVFAVSARSDLNTNWASRGYAAVFEEKIFRLYRYSQPVQCLAEIEGDFTQETDFKLEADGAHIAVYFNGADTFRCANVSSGIFDEMYPDGGVTFVSFAGTAGQSPLVRLDDLRLFEGIEKKFENALHCDLDALRTSQGTAFVRFQGGYQNLGTPLVADGAAFRFSSTAEQIPQYAFAQHDLFAGVEPLLPECYTLSLELRVTSGAFGIAHRTSPGQSWDVAGYAAMFEPDVLRLYQRGPVLLYGEYHRNFSEFVSVVFQVDRAQVKVYVDGALRLQNTVGGSGDADYAEGGVAFVALNRFSGEPAECDVRNLCLSAGLLVTDGNNVRDHRDVTSNQPLDLYVSPNGNDETGDGSRSAPYRTLHRAQTAVRFWQNSAIVADYGSIRVNLENGTYSLDETLEITARDTAALPLVLRGIEAAVVSGGTSFSGDWAVYDAQKRIYRRYLGVENFRQLYVNGNWGIRARYPNAGAETTFRWLSEDRKLTIPVADARNMPRNLTGVECNLVQEWMHDIVFLTGESDYHLLSSRANLSLLDGNAKELLFSQSLQLKDCRGWFENRLEFLDASNEWYYDASNGYLYYRPESNVDVNGLTFMVPRLQTLLSASGDGLQQVKGLQIQNIVFEGAAWNLPGREGFIDNQSTYYYRYENGALALGRPASALQFSGCDNVIVKDCFFRNVAATAIDVSAGCRDVAILHNTVQNVGGNGISVGYIGTDEVVPRLRGTNSLVRNVLLQNNTIVACGKSILSGTGIFASCVRDIEVRNNHISTVPYSGIALGWGWEESARQTRLGKFRVENNLVEYAMNSVMQDGAGIYVLGAHDGNDMSTICGNVVRMNGGLGLIYLDNSSSNWLLNDNVLAGEGDWGCIYLNDYGNLIRNVSIQKTYATSAKYSLDLQTDPNLPSQSQRQITFAGITLLSGESSQWPAEAQKIAANAGVFLG